MNPPTINETDWSYFGGLRFRDRQSVANALGEGIGNSWLKLILVNMLWFLVLFSIFGIPPVTATLFFAARRTLTKEDITYDATLYGIRRYAGAAWAWSLPILGLLLVGYGVSWGVQTQSIPAVVGTIVQLLSALWLGFNLYFWALWWHQVPEQRSVVGTWRKSAAYFRRYPLPTIGGVAVLGVGWLLLLNISWLLLPAFFLIVPIAAALLATVIVGAFPPDDL